MKRYLFTALGTLISIFTFSQNIEIKGKVLDSEKQVLEGASIALYRQDSILVSGSVTDAKGTFRLKNITPDTYKIVVSFVGFISENIKLSGLKQNIDLGNLFLQSDMELKEIVITASNQRYEVNRQIIIPTKSIMEISNNGWNLMRNTQLSRIKINPINNQITTDNGENVILQINGLQVEKEDIMALNSKNIIRIEYLDQPGVRYQAGAVINYIVKQREQGGYLMASGNQTISKNGTNQYTFAGNYNWDKSQLGVILDYNQTHLKWTRENEFNYILPNEEITRIESGEPTLYNDKILKVTIKYALSEPEKYFFSATLRNNFNDVPNQFSNRQGYATTSNSDKKTFFRDFSTWKENAPSWDLYYQRNLKNRQLLIFNIVGTYIDSKSEHNYYESINNASISDINSIINGEKYSIIAEGIYEKDFQQNGKLSVGIRHNQSRTENKYTGTTLSNVYLNYSESYLFADYTYSKKRFSLNAGLSGKYTYYKQSGEDYKKFNPQPRLLLHYTLMKNMVLRYRLNIASSSPSLSDLNDVEQEMDIWQIRRGNPLLENSINYSQSLMYAYKNKYVGIELAGSYSYLNNPTCETIFTENDRIINTIENHKNWQQIQVQSTFNIHPFGQYISLQIRPRFSRFIMNGNNYIHTYNNLSLYATLVASYKHWFLNAQMETRYNTLMGETINYGQNFHMVGAGYNADKWNISAGLYLPFSKNYSQATRNLSNVASSYSNVHTRDFQALVYIAASINLNFGKVKQSKRQRINNQDTGSGILQSGKISM